MSSSLKKISFFFARLLMVCFCICAGLATEAQAPANDDCANAINITIPNGGFGLGNFTSVPTNLTNATVQTGETFAPAIFVAGLDKKSVWYKFSIPTIRAVRVTLTQPGTTITAGDAGFTVYQTDTCLPVNGAISTKLTPIVTFGNTYHPCVPSGDYLIQVSSKVAANGPVTVQLQITDSTGAAYDHPVQAYAFDTVRYYGQKVDFNTECQSIEDATEVCDAFQNETDYNKTAWLTFTTPAYYDYLIVTLSGTGAISSYFPSNNNSPTNRKFGYTLYKGNAVNTPINALQVIDGCDSLQTNGYYADYKVYKCGDLQRKTTYSIQLFINKDFGDDVRLGVVVGGQSATNAPLPTLATVPAPNAIGILPTSPSGTQTSVNDVWGCNSRHNNYSCGAAMPDSGIAYNGGKYNLSSFFTFTLNTTSAIYFNGYVTQCGTQPLIRVFKQGLTNKCTDLDTANIIGVFNNNGTLDCLQPGNYTVQVSGQDYTQYYGYFNYGTPTNGSEQCLSNNLGAAFRLDMTAYARKAANKYSLSVAGAFDSINRVGSVMQPMLDGIGYSSVSDTMGCQNTLRPTDTTCSPVNTKVIYREFNLADSGTIDFSNLTYTAYSPWRYRLYSGDANALASAQNVFSFPDKVSGLIPKTECLDWQTNCTNKTACTIPGTYTFTTMGGDADVGRADKPVFTFVKTRTNHKSPLLAQNLGSIMDSLGTGGGTIKTDVDTWSCDDNAVDINGYPRSLIGGQPATKAIYRQFYLKESALVQIQNTSYYYCYNFAYGIKTLFFGKATDGFAGLTPVGGQWSNFPYSAGSTAGCNLLTAGWYTVVSYGQGPSYDSSFRALDLDGRYNSYVSYRDEYNITITPTCPGPQFDKPYKASIDTTTKQPHLIKWGNQVISTPAYPRTDTTFILPTEHFNCTIDTPFTNVPIPSCSPNANRTVYYVFKTTQVSFLEINTGGYYAVVYDKDVRKDSAQFGSLKPIQVCNSNAGYIQFCFFQPGTYTLVIFASDGNVCQSVTPSIYIDKVGYSRFDYAKNAYDFGIIPPDSVYHYGKAGDVNPLDTGRAPSNDIFYCTTGASNSDPTDPVCGTSINPNVYNNGPNKSLYDSAFQPNNGVARRNLWYTFVIDQPGYVTVKVEPKTNGHAYQQRFAVYESDVDGTLPFSSVVSSGQVDSTTAQGLTFVTKNQQNYYYCPNLYNYASFYRDPCTAITKRYYVLVENVDAEPYEAAGNLPNAQEEVSVLVDSVHLILPKHDHYYQAGDFGTVGVGKFAADTDNYSCATKDATDPFYYYGYNSNCQKTLWYKFTATITGNVRYRMKVNGVYKYDYYNMQLFKQEVPGDSTVNGLKIQGYSSVYDYTENTSWAQCCVSPGTYYIMLTGCDQLNEYVYPEIEMIEAVGDFCGRAVPAVINGPGSVTSSVLVDCHTIGTDYGEFGPQLTCPQGANTADYKSSWFRMDIGGTDTLDVTAYLVENTNAASSDIKYRLMTGDCGAMQEQSCVQDALTQNTYQCLVPGQSYFVQVFTPVTKFNQQVTGTIDLKLSAVAHADTCAPLTNCLASANFSTDFDCNTDDSVKFVNFSTYGTSITYKWDFGYNSQTSTDVSPSFFYPALATDKSYTVKLLVTNTSCQQKDSVTKTIMVPGRPYVNFGIDKAQCYSTDTILLKATSHPGATYQWNDGTTADTLNVTATGNNAYWVKINYNNCSSTDTVNILIDPITAKPVQNIVMCSDPVSLSAYRGVGETYMWINGATTSSISAATPGIYWADIKYFTCTYRDSFIVNNVNTARPLGDDTTLCLSNAGYVLNAHTTGANSYTWQDGSTADTLLVTNTGQFFVSINFGNCVVNDTVNISGFPAPMNNVIDTSICFGQSFTLPWGTTVSVAGVYNDTLKYSGGCDSLIQQVTLSINPKPTIGNDTTICLGQNPYTLDATTAGAVSYTWQDGTTGPVYQVTIPGLYWADVNFGSCIYRDSVTISGFGPPVTTTTDTSICAGSSLTLPWGVVVSSTDSYSDTVRSYLGCDSLVQVVNVTVNAKPILASDTTVSICTGNTIDLTGYYNIGALTANWTIAGTPVADPIAVFNQGVYRLIVANAAGCTDTALVNLTVDNKPALGNDTAINSCEGSFVVLISLYNTTGLTTSWTLNGNAVSAPAAVSVGGIYQLIATNTSLCSDTALINLTFNAKPVLGNDTTISICAGSAIDLTTLYNTTGLSSDWTLNGVAVANPSSVNTSGAYRLIVNNTSNCFDTAFVTLGVNITPKLGNDTLINSCQGMSISLISLYNTAGLTSSWTVNGNQVSDPTSVTASGIYQLIVTNTSLCADTAVVTLTFNPTPSVGNDTSVDICGGFSTNLNSLYNTTGLAANWTINGAPVGDPSLVNTSGIYRLIVTNSSNCSDTAFVTLTVHAKPQLGNDTTVNICAGYALNLSAIYNTGTNNNNWTMNGAAVNDVTAVNTSGVYQLITTSSAGCADTVLLDLVINANPDVVVTNPLPVCAPQTVNLTGATVTAGSTAGLNFTYFTNASASDVYSSATAATSGTYFIKGADANGCFDIKPVTVNYYAMPVVDAGDDLTICDNDSATLMGTVTNITSPVTYQWQPVIVGNIRDPNSATTIVKPAGSQQYILTVNDTYGCNFNVKDTILITMRPPVAAFAGNDTIASAGVPFQLMATGGVSYTWSPGFLLNNPSIANPIATLNQDSVKFTVIVKDIAGCIGHDTVWVRVLQGVRYYVPNAFSPNGDGRNDIFRPVAAGIVSTAWFRIFNRYGQMVFETNQANKGWDGTYKGKPADPDVYVWTIQGTGVNGKTIEMKGVVALVR